jgi:hypothetical protein
LCVSLPTVCLARPSSRFVTCQLPHSIFQGYAAFAFVDALTSVNAGVLVPWQHRNLPPPTIFQTPVTAQKCTVVPPFKLHFRTLWSESVPQQWHRVVVASLLSGRVEQQFSNCAAQTCTTHRNATVKRARRTIS